ncbi:MAG TPA: adenosylcobinamide-phosphate synthase CbiB [Polyangia bacterium]|nr:adenosylcobinamide-phosphate synthase CbiB [Polyangia bacterium]
MGWSLLLPLAGAFTFDWLIGEPPARLHPVVWMGKAIAFAERRVPARGPLAQLGAGALIALAVPALFAGGAALLLAAAAHTRLPGIGLLVATWLLTSTFALRALGVAARAVSRALARGDVVAGRRGLASLCSRDAAALDAPALVAATIESLAENASDSVVAPLFFFALFGIPGAVFYRAVNTLDAMIGYHGRYEYLGKAAARLDDLLNLAPARLTALLLLLAGALAGADASRGWAILRRDGGKTESPNAGRPMAAMAGLLGVELAKVGHYRLGDPLRPLSSRTITAAWRLVVIAALLAFAATAVAIGLRGPREGGAGG